MDKVTKFCVNDKNTIKETISVIQGNFSRCVVVLNENKKVVGVFSEGDVLRTILQNIDLHTPLKKVISPSFLYLKEKNMSKAYELIKKYGITLIPVIDDSFNLKEVITIFDVMKHLEFINGK
ncbi:CBS domain-containing protein [Thermodesulfovibrio yellowstonii]|uniref:CBS domain pair, putative n=1 Tax=Thermodesulfovibrio yellowstonii (strain ATCC 51303 / DSM 11347 / YP87) TaxID=289376 RepID=B5YJB1_THEYD|nr:CBS domain-containing protein [Thermodesulfovibrio yellowstonii]ACI20618.1 CBS domain pair, putative [Thermodesulfovibrio yellowstonii DSM 11347]